MVGRGEDDAPHTLNACRFEQVVGADDVGGVDGLPIRLERVAAEMDDAVDAGDRVAHRREVGQLGGDDFLLRRGIGHRPPVRKTEPVVGAKNRADHAGDAARRAGNENGLHGFLSRNPRTRASGITHPCA